MSSITEQFSAVTKSQLEAQFNIFNTYAHTAVASAEKLIALNLNATRASVEQSSAAARKLFAVKDARELLSVQRDAPTNLDALLAYGRELFAIASNAQAQLIKSGRHLAQSTRETVQQPPAAALSQPAPALAPSAAAPAAPVSQPAPVPDAATTTAAVAATEPVPTAPAAQTLAPVASADSAPAPGKAAAAPASIPAAVSAAVQAAVQAVEAPVGTAPAKPKPVAATVAPTPPEAIKPAVQPAVLAALAADHKPAKLKPVPPKGKPAEAGKLKK